jgi:DNA-cytosine methyltransferase
MVGHSKNIPAGIKESTKVVKTKPGAIKKSKTVVTYQEVQLASLSTCKLPQPLSVHNPFHRLTVGSACSGWGSESFALEQLSRSHVNVFACDSNPKVAMLYKFLHKPQHFFTDVMDKSFAQAPRVDLFVAGFPCQPWSAAGLHQAFNDPRGVVVVHIIHYIATRLPTVWVLENVKGLLTQHREAFNEILKAVREIKDPATGTRAYNVRWTLQNASDHNIPHNRERVFVVGQKITHRKHAWQVPPGVLILGNTIIKMRCTFV